MGLFVVPNNLIILVDVLIPVCEVSSDTLIVDFQQYVDLVGCRPVMKLLRKTVFC